MNAGLTCSLATLALIGAPTLACDEASGAFSGAVATMVVGGAGGAGGDGELVEVTGHAIEVRNENGEVTVVIDGKPVPAERILREQGRLVILDEDGNKHPLFGMLMGDGHGARAFAFRLGGEGEEPFALAWDGASYEPTVMLGIHLDRPGAALEKHLGLEPGTTTMISGIYKGLPAGSAGLGLYDVITAIDGKKPTDPAGFVEALAEHEPGDVVTLSVVQAGKSRKVQVTVEAYDRQRMSEAELEGSPQATWFPNLLQHDGHFRELLIDPKNNQLFRRFDTEQFQDKVRDHMKLLEERYRQAEPALEGRLDTLNGRIDELRRMLDELVEKAGQLSREARED